MASGTHDLRYVAACSMLFDLKLDPAIVADKLGHADASFSIKRYIGIRGDADAATTGLRPLVSSWVSPRPLDVDA